MQGDGVVLTAIKRAEDGQGLVLRLVESVGNDVEGSVRLPREIESAVEELKRALDLDPQYAPAYALRGIAAMLLYPFLGNLIFGGDDRDGFAPVARNAIAEDRLILLFLPEQRVTGHVVLRQDGANARHGECGTEIETLEPGMGIGAPKRGTPQHVVGVQVRRIGEVPLHLRLAVRTPSTDTDAGTHVRGDARRHCEPPVIVSNARRIAPYPVHRHTFPDSASLTSTSVAWGFDSRRCAPATTNPGVQKPH